MLWRPGLGWLARTGCRSCFHAHRFRFYAGLPRARPRGTCASRSPDVFESHAQDVKDVVDHFGLTDHLLAGISLGATTALHARRETGPEGVRGYLHIDQSPNAERTGPAARAGRRTSGRAVPPHAGLSARAGHHPDAEPSIEPPQSVRLSLAFTLSSLIGVLGAAPARERFIRRALPRLPAAIARRVPLLRLDDMRAYLTAYRAAADYRPALAHGDVPVTPAGGHELPPHAPAGQEPVATAGQARRVVRFTAWATRRCWTSRDQLCASSRGSSRRRRR
ncbi:MAG: hypothetical protein IPG81_34170 [Sandaracinaceae bacterium]|nr:hypothetical protein [Sandaracinaceae bacterium]